MVVSETKQGKTVRFRSCLHHFRFIISCLRHYSLGLGLGLGLGIADLNQIADQKLSILAPIQIADLNLTPCLLQIRSSKNSTYELETVQRYTNLILLLLLLLFRTKFAEHAFSVAGQVCVELST